MAPGELLVIGAAQAARLDPQQTVVVTDVRERHGPWLEAVRRGEDQGRSCRYAQKSSQAYMSS